MGFDTHDVAVVILDEALPSEVTLNQYAALPTVDYVDTLDMRTSIAVVGYGIQDRLNKLDPGEFFTRPSQRILDSCDHFGMAEKRAKK